MMPPLSLAVFSAPPRRREPATTDERREGTHDEPVGAEAHSRSRRIREDSRLRRKTGTVARWLRPHVERDTEAGGIGDAHEERWSRRGDRKAEATEALRERQPPASDPSESKERGHDRVGSSGDVQGCLEREVRIRSDIGLVILAHVITGQNLVEHKGIIADDSRGREMKARCSPALVGSAARPHLEEQPAGVR